MGRTYRAAYPNGEVGTLEEAVEDVRSAWDGAYGRWARAGSLLVPGSGEDVLAAVLTVQDPPWPDVHEPYFIIDLFTHPEHRGRGLGAHLVASVVEAFCRTSIGLRVESTNAAAIRLYERNGFVTRPAP